MSAIKKDFPKDYIHQVSKWTVKSQPLLQSLYDLDYEEACAASSSALCVLPLKREKEGPSVYFLNIGELTKVGDEVRISQTGKWQRCPAGIKVTSFRTYRRHDSYFKKEKPEDAPLITQEQTGLNIHNYTIQ